MISPATATAPPPATALPPAGAPASADPPTAPELAATLRPALTRTARRLRQEGGADLSPSLSAALATIARRGPLSPSELAAHERVQRPTATRVAARLEELGLVTRPPTRTTGAFARLAVSDAGTALLEASRARKDAWLTRGLDRLAPDDRLALSPGGGAARAPARGGRAVGGGSAPLRCTRWPSRTPPLLHRPGHLAGRRRGCRPSPRHARPAPDRLGRRASGSPPPCSSRRSSWPAPGAACSPTASRSAGCSWPRRR